MNCLLTGADTEEPLEIFLTFSACDAPFVSGVSIIDDFSSGLSPMQKKFGMYFPDQKYGDSYDYWLATGLENHGEGLSNNGIPFTSAKRQCPVEKSCSGYRLQNLNLRQRIHRMAETLLENGERIYNFKMTTFGLRGENHGQHYDIADKS
uniref:Uncharacterized protein n=1 Tax=Romanomermis culicivorax TaxID=13658 RepID=A0A915KVP5_ROMCU